MTSVGCWAGPAQTFRDCPPWGLDTDAGPGTANGNRQVCKKARPQSRVLLRDVGQASRCTRTRCPGLGRRAPTARVCFSDSHRSKRLSPSGAACRWLTREDGGPLSSGFCPVTRRTVRTGVTLWELGSGTSTKCCRSGCNKVSFVSELGLSCLPPAPVKWQAGQLCKLGRAWTPQPVSAARLGGGQRAALCPRPPRRLSCAPKASRRVQRCLQVGKAPL